MEAIELTPEKITMSCSAIRAYKTDPLAFAVGVAICLASTCYFAEFLLIKYAQGMGWFDMPSTKDICVLAACGVLFLIGASVVRYTWMRSTRTSNQ
ncbi:hypothetical protein [Burkholderia sp. S171]|uniref:hypothetical protein n=1 Tax=Burkholderia sp. S171 TaxID=1641860 RepID=UPI00131E8002|nr:hypothetical protein [Burkholderia sp. S171]